MINHLGLFEGIGGFSLAARWSGWETVAYCEIDPFCQNVLKYHFPKAEVFSDIKKSDFSKYANKIDIITGGFPCQPFSITGKRFGKEDDRYLWPEMLRVIREVRPAWVVGENVFGLINWSGGVVFDEAQTDMEREGYEVQAYVLPACGVNAPHKRDRVWFVAYSGSNGHKLRRLRESGQKEGEREGVGKQRERIWNDGRRNGESWITANSSNIRYETPRITRSGRSGFEDCDKPITPHTNNERRQECNFAGIATRSRQHHGICDAIPGWENFPTQPPVCGGNDGVSYGLDGIAFPKWRNESIKAYGNAIVPQVAFQIFKSINEYSKLALI